ncbi:MAG: hypothetical protein U0360_09300 [Dehalococcoidia bacterium]
MLLLVALLVAAALLYPRPTPEVTVAAVAPGPREGHVPLCAHD